jgi:SAM-dependent methyltransferase
MAYEASTYGDRIASVYDAWVAPNVDATTEHAVAFLADIAGPESRALELGIGTGRVALPLAERGVHVDGIDASEAMLAQLRAKVGAAALRVSVGDFADVGMDGPYKLIYVVFNTFFALLSQEEQVRCFANVASKLRADGAFVIEAFVPDPSMFDRGQRVSATRVELDRVQLNAIQHDAVNQRTTTQYVHIGKEGIMLLPVQLRYAWPSELDLMARLAGLVLAARYGGWQREPFTSTSASHVSVFTRK